MAISEGAGCPLAWDAVRDIKCHMDRLCALSLTGPPAMLPLIDQHRAILAAIDNLDADAAAEAMRIHLTEIIRVLPKAEAAFAELFE